MTVIGKLAGYSLDLMIGADVSDVEEAVARLFRDHSPALRRALQRAGDRAWQALAVALAPEALSGRLGATPGAAEAQFIRDQIVTFLGGFGDGFAQAPALRRACLQEMRHLRNSGALSAPLPEPDELGREAAAARDQRQARVRRLRALLHNPHSLQTAQSQLQHDPDGTAEQALVVAGQLADSLAADHPNLAQFLRRHPPGGPPPLVTFFVYFLRREIEADVSATQSLTPARLGPPSPTQAAGLDALRQAMDRLDGGQEGDPARDSGAATEGGGVGQAPQSAVELRDVVRELLAQRDVWLQARQARAAQDELLADLAARKLRLEQRLAPLQTRGQPQAQAPVVRPPAGWSPPVPVAPRAEPPPHRPALAQDRAALSRLANRFQHALAVDAAVLARINQIVEDGDRPLGEAVALLPDQGFAPLLRESPEDHADRLAAWAEALRECQRRLENEIRRDEASLRPWLGVRDLWLGRERDEDGRAAWQEYLAGCRDEAAAEVARLEAEVGRVTGEAP
jgi:hypothetical protein